MICWSAGVLARNERAQREKRLRRISVKDFSRLTALIAGENARGPSKSLERTVSAGGLFAENQQRE